MTRTLSVTQRSANPLRAQELQSQECLRVRPDRRTSPPLPPSSRPARRNTAFDLGELRDRKVALVGLAQADREIGLPAREFDVVARRQKCKRQARMGTQQRAGARRQHLLRNRIGAKRCASRPTGPGRLAPIRPISAACTAIAWMCASTTSHCRVGLRRPSAASNRRKPSARSIRASRRPTRGLVDAQPRAGRRHRCPSSLTAAMMRRSSQFMASVIHRTWPACNNAATGAICLREQQPLLHAYIFARRLRWKIHRDHDRSQDIDAARRYRPHPSLACGDSCLVLIDIQNEYLAGPHRRARRRARDRTRYRVARRSTRAAAL
jgi:hypothetical protein